jgi:hypothetical protein
MTEFLGANGMKRAPHQPYSPDLAPRDFYLFGFIKGRFAGVLFEEPDHLLQSINALFQSMPLKKPHWSAYFRNGWTDWRNVMWQLVV